MSDPFAPPGPHGRSTPKNGAPAAGDSTTDALTAGALTAGALTAGAPTAGAPTTVGPARVDLVRVEYRKYDGRPHRAYPAIRLGEDEYGTWLGVPGAEFVARAGGAGFKYDDPYVLLVPRNVWWTAIFNAPPRRTEVYCDVTTPAAWADDRVRLIDLDLDVRRRRGESDPELVDEDEFATHQQAFHYPPHVVAEARAAAQFLLGVMRANVEPFVSAFRPWLARVHPPR